MNTKLTELLNEYYGAKAVLEERCATLFKEAIQDIFAKYPAIETIAWFQYTPYFNDGDACEFGVDTEPYINGLNSYGEAHWSDDRDDDDTANPIPTEVYGEVSALLGSIPEEIMKDIFGDHAKITIDREKITVDEFEHD